jgi:parvulin-like peptidyl-prolyl isomerase
MKMLHTYKVLFLGVVSLNLCMLGASALRSTALPSVTKKSSQEAQVTTQKKNSATKKVSTKDTTNTIATQPALLKDAPVAVKTSHIAKKDTQKNTADLPQGDLVDKIEVTIYGDDGVQIITKSDLERLSIDGQERTKDEIILERLMFLDAQKMHMVQGDEAVDAYLNNIQREHNMNKEQLEYLFANSGYSYEEAREQLRILYAVNSIVDFKIRSRLIVPEQDVVTYYKSHPVHLQPTYQIQRAVVALPIDETQHASFKKEVELLCQTGTSDIVPVWDEPFWIEKGDIAESKKFITTMRVGACAVSGETSEGIELFKLADKKEEREQSLEERYREITDILRRPKYEELLAEYKKQLRESATIVYL